MQKKANQKTAEINNAFNFLKENWDYIIKSEDENIFEDYDLTNEDKDKKKQQSNNQYPRKKIVIIGFLFVTSLFIMHNYLKLQDFLILAARELLSMRFIKY